MLIGYARVSTIEHTLDLQADALHKDGCEQVFTDRISGAKFGSWTDWAAPSSSS